MEGYVGRSQVSPLSCGFKRRGLCGCVFTKSVCAIPTSSDRPTLSNLQQLIFPGMFYLFSPIWTNSLGIDGNYSGHSFRRGATTSARLTGLTQEEIQLLGRWKSDSWRLYVQIHELHIINTSLRFQCPPASTLPYTN